MITLENYYSKIKKLDVSSFPKEMMDDHELINEVTDNGSFMERITGDEDYTEFMSNHLLELNAWIKKNAPAEPVKEKTSKPKEQKPAKAAVERSVSPDREYQKQTGKTPRVQAPKKETESNKVEHFPEEFRFIRRFVNLQGKTKTKEEILNFIKSLQRSMTEKRMTKDSPYRKQIDYIQEVLIKNYNRMHSRLPVKLDEKVIGKYRELLKEKIIFPSVKFIKQFVSIQGKPNMRSKAKRLLESLNRASEKKLITRSDKYYDKLKKIYDRLHEFIKTPKEHTIKVSASELSGLKEAMGCGCKPESKDGIGELPGSNYGGKQPMVMNSLEFANLRFEKLDFKGKWREFIGNPSPGFSMVVYAKPKMGKSFMCIDFAGYLARNHGKVLYVAREEGLDDTLQEKLNETNVKHINLDVSSYMPQDVSMYNFVFLDSVNKLELSPKDLEILKKQYPVTSFISVFQSTKDGKVRGNNEYLHDADVIVELPEVGRAVQFGRFNQGSEMNIFENENF